MPLHNHWPNPQPQFDRIAAIWHNLSRSSRETNYTQWCGKAATSGDGNHSLSRRKRARLELPNCLGVGEASICSPTSKHAGPSNSRGNKRSDQSDHYRDKSKPNDKQEHLGVRTFTTVRRAGGRIRIVD